VKLKKVTLDGVAYAVNTATGEVYTMQSYEKLKKHPDEKLDYVGQLVKKGSKYTIEPRKETV
jgi:oligoendopeptidase F